MRKKMFIGCGVFIFLSLAIFQSSKLLFDSKAKENLSQKLAKTEDSETARIKSSIDSYWEHSKNNDGKLYNFLSDYPESFFEKCRKPEIPAKNDENFYSDKIEGRSTRVENTLKSLSEDIQNKSVEFISYKSFIIQEDEAIAYIDYDISSKDKGVVITGKHRDMGFFLTKGTDNQWRIFMITPKSVVDSSDFAKNFAKKRDCEK